MLKNWNTFEKFLLIANMSIALMFLIIGGDYSIIPLLSVLASLGNTMSVILVAKKEIRNYAWGILGVVTYGFVAFYYTNTGEWMLNWLYYLPMNIIGWIMWTKKSDDGESVKSKSLTLRQAGIVYSCTIAAVLFYAMLISNPAVQTFLYGAVTPYGFSKFLIDATSTILSITAMLLMVKCYKEQWILWIIVDVVSIVLWCITFDFTMILMWVTMLANAVYGYIRWRKEGE